MAGGVAVEREQLPSIGSWDRWSATKRGRGAARFIVSRPGVARERVDIRERVRLVRDLRHPSLSRLIAFREEPEAEVIEDVGEGAVLDRLSDRAISAGGVIGVLEALAYMHRAGVSHGNVRREALVARNGRLVLTGAAIGAGGEDGFVADVRAWAKLAVELLADYRGPLASAVVETSRRILCQADDVAPPAGRLATALRRAWREAGPAAVADEPVGSADGTLMKVLHALGDILLGALTTVITAGVIAGAVVLGAMWFLDQLPQEVPVPDVVGLPREEAREILQRAALQVGGVRPAYSDEYEPGEVIATKPEGGMLVRQGREVTLVVSLGSAQVEVPSVTGLTVREARELLGESDLQLEVLGQTRSSAPKGEIVRQNPAPGERVARGESVYVQVSGGPQFGQLEVPRGDGETAVAYFRTLKITVPAGDPLQRVRILEGYDEPLEVTYDRLHRPGDTIEFETWGREGKRIEVRIEGERVYRTQL